jgi:pilus assembly protein CpaC
VITVTPRLVRPVRPGDIVLPTDRIQPSSDADLFLLGKTEKRVPAPKAPDAAAVGGVEGAGHIVK